MTLPEWAIDALGLPREASPTARHIDALHAAVITTTFVGTAIIALFTLYFVIRYRRKREGEATEHVQATPLREWTQSGLLLGLFILFWIIGYRQYLEVETPPKDAMVVYVSAKQWMWKFTYDDGQSTNDTLYIPEHKHVRLVMTSRDVIHSFYAPSFRVKQDVVPGRWINIWLDSAEPGTYPIECAEYCGVSHSNMLGQIRVLTESEWADWRRGKNPGEMIARGREVARIHGCLACHTLDGQTHIGPTWSRLYDSQVKLSDGRTVVADEAYLTRSMMDPLADVVDGFNPVMPSFRGQLTAEETGALVELIRSLKDGGEQQAVKLPVLDVKEKK